MDKIALKETDCWDIELHPLLTEPIVTTHFALKNCQHNSWVSIGAEYSGTDPWSLSQAKDPDSHLKIVTIVMTHDSVSKRYEVVMHRAAFWCGLRKCRHPRAPDPPHGREPEKVL